MFQQIHWIRYWTRLKCMYPQQKCSEKFARLRRDSLILKYLSSKQLLRKQRFSDAWLTPLQSNGSENLENSSTYRLMFIWIGTSLRTFGQKRLKTPCSDSLMLKRQHNLSKTFPQKIWTEKLEKFQQSFSDAEQNLIKNCPQNVLVETFEKFPQLFSDVGQGQSSERLDRQFWKIPVAHLWYRIGFN